MWYTERRYRHPTDSRKERHNEEERIFGRRGSAEYQLGGVPEDHEKSGRKAEKREKAEVVQPEPPSAHPKGAQAVEKARGFFDSLERTAQAVLLPYVKGKLLYFWRYCPHTCGQEVML